MSTTTILVYDDQKFDEACARYVEGCDESSSPVLKAERQADVDGAKRFLKSRAAEKLHVRQATPKE